MDNTHANAAGCCISDSKLNDFHKYANEKLRDIDFSSDIYEVNFVRDGSSLDLASLIMDIGKYESIWGQGNPTPLICAKGIRVEKSDITVMGARQDTLKIVYNGISYIKFFAKDDIERIAQWNSDILDITIIGKANINYWGGRAAPQIFITDMDIKNSLFDF